ncbi:MAG: hypothetical protein ABI840_09105 [bacterium]
MYNNNLIELLKTFSIKEVKEFREFLNSAYFNKRRAVNKLYEIIIKFHPDFESKSFTKQKVFERLFPGKKYSDGSLRVSIHYLTELAEKFLAFQSFESNEHEFSIQLESVLVARNQNKLFEKNMNKAFGNLDKSDIDAEDFYFYKFRLESQLTFFKFSSSYAYLDKVISKLDYDNVFKKLTHFYQLKSMHMYLNTLNLQLLYNKEFNCASFKSLISKMKPEDYEDIPVIKMYYYLIKMKTGAEHESYYFKLKEILLLNKKIFNKYDLIVAYVQMGGYCIARILKGDMIFERERFELYKEEIAQKTYLINDNMSPLFYRNVVLSAITLKEFDWVKEFIHTYKSKLSKKYRENYFYYCLAIYEFNMKNFEYSLELISKIKYDEIYMKLKSKILHLQLLYELGFEDSLADSQESFRHFLNNNKLISPERQFSFINFHKYLNRITLLKNKKDIVELEQMRLQLKEETKIVNKDWLLEKTDNIHSSLRSKKRQLQTLT